MTACSSGSFTSADPVYGGGANAYGYPTDPVNGSDLDGRNWITDKYKAGKKKVSSGLSSAKSFYSKHKTAIDIGVTVVSFVPVVGVGVRGAMIAYKGYRTYKAVTTSRNVAASASSSRNLVDDLLLMAKKKKAPAKNADRKGHSGGKNWDKHPKAQGHGGQKKFVNDNKRRRDPGLGFGFAFGW